MKDAIVPIFGNRILRKQPIHQTAFQKILILHFLRRITDVFGQLRAVIVAQLAERILFHSSNPISMQTFQVFLKLRKNLQGEPA